MSAAGHLQSTNPALCAAGDTADPPGMKSTTVAVFKGKVAASNMLKASQAVSDRAVVPPVVFTIPELARMGLLEGETAEQGIDVDVRYCDTSGCAARIRIRSRPKPVQTRRWTDTSDHMV